MTPLVRAFGLLILVAVVVAGTSKPLDDISLDDTDSWLSPTQQLPENDETFRFASPPVKKAPAAKKVPAPKKSAPTKAPAVKKAPATKKTTPKKTGKSKSVVKPPKSSAPPSTRHPRKCIKDHLKKQGAKIAALCKGDKVSERRCWAKHMIVSASRACPASWHLLRANRRSKSGRSCKHCNQFCRTKADVPEKFAVQWCLQAKAANPKVRPNHCKFHFLKHLCAQTFCAYRCDPSSNVMKRHWKKWARHKKVYAEALANYTKLKAQIEKQRAAMLRHADRRKKNRAAVKKARAELNKVDSKHKAKVEANKAKAAAAAGKAKGKTEKTKFTFGGYKRGGQTKKSSALKKTLAIAAKELAKRNAAKKHKKHLGPRAKYLKTKKKLAKTQHILRKRRRKLLAHERKLKSHLRRKHARIKKRLKFVKKSLQKIQGTTKASKAPTKATTGKKRPYVVNLQNQPGLSKRVRQLQAKVASLEAKLSKKHGWRAGGFGSWTKQGRIVQNDGKRIVVRVHSETRVPLYPPSPDQLPANNKKPQTAARKHRRRIKNKR